MRVYYSENRGFFPITLIDRAIRVTLIILLFTLMIPIPFSYGQVVTAVQSANIKPYNDAIKGFESACSCTVDRFVVSEMKDRDLVKEVRETRPDIILAVGSDALAGIKDIRNIPIVHVMVLNPSSIIQGNKNTAGVSMYVSAEKQLEVVKQARPGIKNIGLLFDPAKTGDFVNKARPAAIAAGMDLLAVEVYNSQDVPRLIEDMRGKIDAFLMLPDTTVLRPETTEFLLLFALDNRIPVVTFSEKYLEMGALVSLDLNTYAVGRQAWDIAKRILSGEPAGKIGVQDSTDILIKVNRRIADKLGISVSPETLKKSCMKGGE